MGEKQTTYKLDRPYITNNGHGGVVYISVENEDRENPIAEMRIHQDELHPTEDGKIKRRKRTGYIGGDIGVLLSPDMEYDPGERIGGVITILESYDPPDPEDPTAFLKMDEGKIVRVNGRCVYRVEVYSYNAQQIDQLIEEDNNLNAGRAFSEGTR